MGIQPKFRVKTAYLWEISFSADSVFELKEAIIYFPRFLYRIT